MVPFFGSKVTQSSDVKGYEGLLDIYTGSGNNSVEKQGIGPMFKPEAGLTHIYGAPNNTEYIQNRMKDNLTSKMNNVKPWQEIQVAPGLGKGYTSQGSGGFNSGMEQRNKYMPKTVDQLRTKTNPKVTYGGQVLGAYAGKGSTKAAQDMMHAGRGAVGPNGKPIQVYKLEKIDPILIMKTLLIDGSLLLEQKKLKPLAQLLYYNLKIELQLLVNISVMVTTVKVEELINRDITEEHIDNNLKVKM